MVIKVKEYQEKVQKVQLRECPAHLDAASQCRTGRRYEILELVGQDCKERREGDYDFRAFSQESKEGCQVG